MEYFWLAERILAQLCKQITEQQREEVIAEAVCAAWCSHEMLTHLLMSNCVRGSVRKHLSHKFRSSPIMIPLHTLHDAIVPPPELPHRAKVVKLADYLKMPTLNQKLALQ